MTPWRECRGTRPGAHPHAITSGMANVSNLGPRTDALGAYFFPFEEASGMMPNSRASEIGTS